ncbi:MAG: hypothetical protein BroJett025_07180 [Patescibacteria group bacterium]|nr:MAG: hypothetical protein BroJett025_07180 [Patescibacteria group bacterium]
MIEPNEKQEQGSFPSGLIVGFLAGAVGYFLTQTKEGKEMREKFANQWQELRDSLISEGKLSETESEFTDYVRAAKSKISEFLGELDQSSETQKRDAKKKVIKRKKKLFKGI